MRDEGGHSALCSSVIPSTRGTSFGSSIFYLVQEKDLDLTSKCPVDSHMLVVLSISL